MGKHVYIRTTALITADEVAIQTAVMAYYHRHASIY